MLDNEIIKAADVCSNSPNCNGCPCNKDGVDCIGVTDILGVINRQKAEIERLREENKNFADIGKMYSEIKAEAIKEFAERAKSLVHHTVVSSVYGVMLSISENAFDNLVKEMVGEG